MKRWKPGAGTGPRLLLERALNRLLELDPETGARLAVHAGRRIELRSAGGTWTLRLRLEEGGTVVLEDAGADPAPDLYLEGSPPAFFGLWRQARGDGASGSSETLRVSGDARLLSALSAVLRDFRPDLEGELARHVGDAAALGALRWARALMDWLRAALDKAARDTAEQLHRAQGLLPGRNEVRDFLDETDRLRDAVEGLRLRLQSRERRPVSRGGAP